MTPLSSMTLAASPPISPPVLRSLDKPLAGSFGPIPSDVMTPQRRRSVQALLACASNLGRRRRYHSAANGKGQNALASQKRWNGCANLDRRPESVDDERR